MTDAPTDSLLLRLLRSLVGRVVTLRCGDNGPIGRLIEADAGHVLLETPIGDRSLIPIDETASVESGPGEEATYERKWQLYAKFLERSRRIAGEQEERRFLQMLEVAERGVGPRPSIADPDGFLRGLTGAEREDER